MKKQKGFTLIELMVVMAIIAILATAGLSAYTGYIKGARDSARITIVRQLQTIVEALTTISGPPTPQQVADYLTAEGLAWNISTENPLLVDITKSLVSAVGVWGVPNTLALIDDPVGGKAVCLDHEKNATMVCQFVYYKFSDGTYAISYGVELEKNLVNAHYSALPTPRTYGSFIGTSSVVNATFSGLMKNIEDSGEHLQAAGITAESTTVSQIASGSTNSGPNGATNNTGNSCNSTINCNTPGDVCRYNPWSGNDGKFCGLPHGNNTAPCDASDECESGLFCTYSSVCSTGDVGANCQNNSYCPVSGYCNTSVYLCSNGSSGDWCNSDTGCSSGTCENNMCT